MPWYALTSTNIDGFPIKRELLYRDSKDKVIDFLLGRFKRRNGIPEEVWGWQVTEATTDETWDWDIEEPRERTPYAVEVPLLFREAGP